MRLSKTYKAAALILAIMFFAGTAYSGQPVFASSGLDIEPLKGVQGSEDSAESWRYEDGAIIDDDQDQNAQMGSSMEEGSSLQSRPGDPGYGENNNKSWSFSGIKCSGGYLKGIDVSYWQYDINWEKVKKVVDNGNLDFVIIRCGYGKKTDSKFARNAAACEKYDIPYGVYLYSYATSKTYAKDEAKNALSIIKGYHPTYPVYYDLEDNSVRKKGRTNITNYAKIFCSTIAASGYKAGVYANLSWFNSYIDGAKLRNLGYDLWLAQWPGSDKNYSKYGYGNRYSIWQCGVAGASGKQYIPGINGRIDIDLQVISHEAMQKYMGGEPVLDTLSIVAPDKEEGYIGEESVVSRMGPGSGFKESSTYYFGEKVTIMGMSNGYYQLYTESSETGNWIPKESLIGENDPWEKVTEEEETEDGPVLRTYIRTFGGEIITSSWVDLNGARYYVDESGAALTGIQLLDGYTYGFNEGGSMYRNTTIAFGNEQYTFDSKGRAYLYKAKTKKKIKYRKGPGLKYKKKGTFKKNTTVRVIRESGTWCQLKSGYWVNVKYLSPTVTYPIHLETEDPQEDTSGEAVNNQ